MIGAGFQAELLGNLRSFPEVLAWRAQTQLDRLAFRLLSTDGNKDTSLTYHRLARRVRVLASRRSGPVMA